LDINTEEVLAVEHYGKRNNGHFNVVAFLIFNLILSVELAFLLYIHRAMDNDFHGIGNSAS
jgi:hypothetical protein